MGFRERSHWGFGGYEGKYQISNCGRVRSLQRYRYYPNYEPRYVNERILKQYIDDLGYCRVSLHNNDKGRRKKVHILVLETFVGKKPTSMECRHLDGNPTNNHIENLVWDTHAMNCKDTIKHGRSTRGSKQHMAKFEEAFES